jgi:hypothetical protein
MRCDVLELGVCSSLRMTRGSANPGCRDRLACHYFISPRSFLPICHIVCGTSAFDVCCHERVSCIAGRRGGHSYVLSSHDDKRCWLMLQGTTAALRLSPDAQYMR